MIKINVSDLLQSEGAQEKFVKEKVSKIKRGINLTGDLLVKARIYKIDDGVLAEIEISGKEKITCDRCLEKFEKRIKKKFSQEFVVPIKNLKGEELDERQVGFIIDEKNEIDLEKPIVEEILLDNERNICKTDCKGLCPKCGKNLNKEKCKCAERKTNVNPFIKLKKLERK